MRSADARTFGQDLMRGEHRVGGGQVKAGYQADSYNANLDPKTQRALGAYMAIGGATVDREEGASVTGTSIFDPVLCELAYRWFCPPGGLVLDPFAGGSVRGIVASKLGRAYTGIDLSDRQIAANRAQAERICGDPMPAWHVGDSRNIAAIVPDAAADFVFSCPPYADLERYSDDAADLSTLAYAEFRPAYAAIIAAACGLLKPDRFACFVVGDVRDKRGMYHGLPWHTVEAFQAAGLRLYNEAVLVTAVGSLPIRVAKQFTSGRKLGKTHQNVLVFVKGDPRKATQACGPVEIDPALFAEAGDEGGAPGGDQGADVFADL